VGFREERDTIDGIYVLKIAVDREITEDNGKAVLLFADMNGAFDNLKVEVIRRILKEIKIDEQIKESIEKIYERTSCTVKVNEKEGKFIKI
jgi:2-hydroxy-3-keto-5-methylthiopentenyl-1-phosphate phosphatase